MLFFVCADRMSIVRCVSSANAVQIMLTLLTMMMMMMRLCGHCWQLHWRACGWVRNDGFVNSTCAIRVGYASFAFDASMPDADTETGSRRFELLLALGALYECTVVIIICFRSKNIKAYMYICWGQFMQRCIEFSRNRHTVIMLLFVNGGERCQRAAPHLYTCLCLCVCNYDCTHNDDEE